MADPNTPNVTLDTNQEDENLVKSMQSELGTTDSGMLRGMPPAGPEVGVKDAAAEQGMSDLDTMREVFRSPATTYFGETKTAEAPEYTTSPVSEAVSRIGSTAKPQADYNQKQEQWISKADGFYMMPEDGSVPTEDDYVVFSADSSQMELASKMRKIYRNGGSYVRVYDDEGNPVIQDGQYVRAPLSWVSELERYTTPYSFEEGNVFEDVGEVRRMGQRLFTGPTGSGDLGPLNTKLENLGVSNPIARTMILRGIATGKWEREQTIKQLQDLGSFAITIPEYAVNTANSLTVDFAMTMMEAFSGDPEMFSSEKVEARKKFKKLSENLDLKKILGLQDTIEKRSGNIYDPKLIEEVLEPRGIINVLASYAGPEAALLGPWAGLKTARASKHFKGFKDFIKKNYDTDNPVVAFEKGQAAGLSPKEVVENYTSTLKRGWFKQKRRRAAEDIDFMISRSTMKPGDERTALFKQQMASLNDRADRAQETLRSAEAIGKTGVAKKQRVILQNLDEERYQLAHGYLTPKYYTDIMGEGALTVGATTATLAIGDMFYNDSVDKDDKIFFEIGSAISVGLGNTASNFAAGELFNNTYNTTVDFLAYLRGKAPFTDEEWKSAAEQWAGSKKAKRALRELAKQPTEFRDTVINGLAKTGEIRDRLIELSARTGVKIDENLMITNIAVMSGLGQLMDVSRQLDEKIVATALSDISGPIMEQHRLLNSQKLLVSQMAKAAKQLTELKMAGDLADDDPIVAMLNRMADFSSSMQGRINDEKAALNQLMTKNREALEGLMSVDLTDDLNRDNTTLTALSNMMDVEMQMYIDDLSDAAKTSLEPLQQEFLQQHIAKLAEVRRKHFDMLDRVTRGISWEEASSGKASLHAGNLFAYNQKGYQSTASKMYSEFDLNNGDAKANVVNLFDDMMDTGNDFLELPTVGADVQKGIDKLRNFDMIPKDRREFSLIFNGAAENGLASIRGKFDNPKQYEEILETLEIDPQDPPIKQWMQLRDGLAKKSDELGLSPEEAQAFYEQMPLLISASDWRKIDSHLGKVARKNRDESRQAYYYRLKDNWQNVGKDTLEDGSENPYAFMRNWEGANGEPAVPVGPEVYAEYRKISDWYRVNVSDRYYTDDVVRKMDTEVSTRVKSAAVKPGEETEESLAAMQKEMGKTDVKNMPVHWLDNIMKGLTNQGVPLSGDRLYSQVGAYLGKLGGGVYDEATGRYLLLSDSALPDDQEAIEVAKQLKAIVTRHLQGKAALQLGDQLLPRDANGKLIFEGVPDALKYDENMFKSMFNIKTYRRKADGTFEEAGNLFNEEEIFDSISLSTLEKNRLDLKRTFEEAESYVNKMQDQVDLELNKYVWVDPKGKRGRVAGGAQAAAEREIQFANNMLDKIYRIRAQRTGDEVTFPTLSPGQSIEKQRQAIWDTFIDSPTGPEDMARVRNMLVEMGEDPDYVDDFVARSVNDYISKQVMTPSGNMTVKRADGTMTEVEEWKISSNKIYEILGEADSDTRTRLANIIGEDAMETWSTVAEAIRRIDPPPSGSGIDTHVSSMSLDSVLSRIYNINRGVVSVQWVATESIIRAARNHHGMILKTMLQDPDAAKALLEIIETGKIPKYKTEPSWLRLLTANVILQEARNGLIKEPMREYNFGLEYEGIDEAVTPQPAKPAPKPELTPIDVELGEVGIRPMYQQPQAPKQPEQPQ